MRRCALLQSQRAAVRCRSNYISRFARVRIHAPTRRQRASWFKIRPSFRRRRKWKKRVTVTLLTYDLMLSFQPSGIASTRSRMQTSRCWLVSGLLGAEGSLTNRRNTSVVFGLRFERRQVRHYIGLMKRDVPVHMERARCRQLRVKMTLGCNDELDAFGASLVFGGTMWTCGLGTRRTCRWNLSKQSSLTLARPLMRSAVESRDLSEICVCHKLGAEP